jgi:hypothetical protein
MQQQEVSTVRLWASRVRSVAAWLVLPAFVSMFVANKQLNTKYPGPFPAYLPRPGELEWLLWWRNWSLIALVVCALVSLPRWQSLVGLGALLLFFLLFGGI